LSNLPKPFIIFIDKAGDPIDSITSQATDETIFSLVQSYNQDFPDDAPIVAWEWTPSGMRKYTGRSKSKDKQRQMPQVVTINRHKGT
jgi:hypothetical protein